MVTEDKKSKIEEKSEDEKKQEKVKRIKNNVEFAYNFFQASRLNYINSTYFTLVNTITVQDQKTLELIKKPNLTFNVLEAFYSRLLGEFSNHEPSFSATSKDQYNVNDQLLAFVDGKIRQFDYECAQDNLKNDLYKNMLIGGYDVAQMYIDYESERSLHKCIKMTRIDPLLTFFDPLAQCSHKGDGKFCGYIKPMKEDEFKKEYGIDVSEIGYESSGYFNWSCFKSTDKFIMVAIYWEKEPYKIKLVQVDSYVKNGRQYPPKVMELEEYEEMKKNWDGIEAAPIYTGEPVEKDVYKITKTEAVGNKILRESETKYRTLPLIMFSGNAVRYREWNMDGGEVKELQRPYGYNAEGMQRLKNQAGISLANELKNMVNAKFLMPAKAMNKEYSQTHGYFNIQDKEVIVYNHDDTKGNPIPPPTTVTRSQIPSELSNTFLGADQAIQNIFGSYDAALGINDNQLSGKAIDSAASHSNASAKPFIVGFFSAYNQCAKFYKEMLPIVYSSERFTEVRDDKGKSDRVLINRNDGEGLQIKFEPDDIEVKIEAGVNFEAQRREELNQVVSIITAMPGFAKFMETKALDKIISLLNWNASDDLMNAAKAFMQENAQAQQMQQEIMKQQAQFNPQLLNAKNDEVKNQLQKMQMQLDAAQQQRENDLKQMQIRMETYIKLQQDETNRLKVLSEAQTSQEESMEKLDRNATIRANTEAKLILERKKHEHEEDKHAIDTIFKIHDHVSNKIDSSENNNLYF